jgi:hypothetical protein
LSYNECQWLSAIRSIQTFSEVKAEVDVNLRLEVKVEVEISSGNPFIDNDRTTLNFGRVFVMRSGSKLWGALTTFKMKLLPRNRESTDNLDGNKDHNRKEDGKYLPDDLTGGKGHPDRRPSCSRSLAIGTRRKFAYASKFSFKMLFISLTPFYF